MCCSDTSRLAPPGRARPRGFSLVELMISIGILGVGLAMAAALFPAAIIENQQSANDILGTIMCENALAVVKAKIKANDPNLTDLIPLASDPIADANFVCITGGLLTEVDLAYPAPGDPNDPSDDPNDWIGTIPDRRPSTRRGCVVLARRMKADENDFQIVVVAFRKKDPNHKVAVVPLTDPNIYDAGEVSLMTITDGDPNNVKLDSPVIIVDTADPSVVHIARVAVIRSSGEAVLDRRVPPIAIGNARVWAIVEIDPDTGDPVAGIDTSPAIATLVVRTSLRQ